MDFRTCVLGGKPVGGRLIDGFPIGWGARFAGGLSVFFAALFDRLAAITYGALAEGGSFVPEA